MGYNMGIRQAGKGDKLRPKAKILDKNILLTNERSRKKKDGHCNLCDKRIYRSFTVCIEGKTITVGKCCKSKLYK